MSVEEDVDERKRPGEYHVLVVVNDHGKQLIYGDRQDEGSERCAYLLMDHVPSWELDDRGPFQGWSHSYVISTKYYPVRLLGKVRLARAIEAYGRVLKDHL